MVLNNKKGIITVIEMSLLILLFSTSSYNILSNPNFEHPFQESVDSMLDAIYQSKDFTYSILSEDLTEFFPQEDYTGISLLLNDTYENYELIISNGSISKKIYECVPKYSKLNSQRIFTIYNNTVYEYRVVTLGVCF